MVEFLIQSLGSPAWLAWTLVALLQAGLILGLVATGALIFIWMERKISGRIQDRLGPTRVGGKFGWLQTLADGIKLISKEDTMPGDADPLLFRVAPYVSFSASLTAFLALPFAANWAALNLNAGVFFLLAIVGLEVFGVILAGYASASKWSLFGAMREAAQVVSYEVPLGLCVVVPVVLAGSMDLSVIGESQRGWFTNWYVFHDPFTFITFWVYFTCATASVNRAPFDLAEAESELVAGFHTEYSGFRWSIFFLAEYGSMFLVSMLAGILFFGGWNGPIPLFDLLGWSYLPFATEPSVLGYLANLAGVGNVILKGVIGVTVMMWVRWTLPRLRIDQVMTTCLKYCTPIAAVMFLGVVFWQQYHLPSMNQLLPFGHYDSAGKWVSFPAGSIREEWSVGRLNGAAASDTPSTPAPTETQASHLQKANPSAKLAVSTPQPLAPSGEDQP
ncbi:MAG: NADH-quinone oxidoreductase subunit NuoH [Pirellulales bacterium]|nr:NADH-quinone oxidoreductase subunit NuoH [Pirellulales bacterium]